MEKDKKVYFILAIIVVLNCILIEYLIFHATQNFDVFTTLIRIVIIAGFGILGMIVGFKIFKKMN